ncbi:hypothetical protein M422DRAFT_36443 [Sphaerobolus stellatus SS14]|uniref:Unplaced genomic scaffold SPHSTscaffold_180, whole genome shotgun sequence n=1 Tax=Sphaerobolus stellatus (strain SS14) TaxID=990650 RepID=A0A0C9U8G0_SPHS4|nr:hypothetical protein M422DRAFT_36443 [Sphaerobolus stellatus SS14]
MDLFSIQDNYLQSFRSAASRESCKAYGRKSELNHYSLWTPEYSEKDTYQMTINEFGTLIRSNYAVASSETPESCGEIYDSKIGYREVEELFKQRGRHAFQGRSPVNRLFTV